MSARPVVLKFGGTSLQTADRVRRAARRVAVRVREGASAVVVVSARGHATDLILRELSRVTGVDGGREADRALATGEDLSAALLAAALQGLAVPARSLRGGEAGIEAAGDHGAGTIRVVRPQRLLALLAEGVVPVVSGFQGERDDRETLTLGRGGSDTTAVALAAALGASCEIVTDVDAVYDRDPNRDQAARPYLELTVSELVRLAEEGAQVVHPAAARLAERHGVPLHIYSFRAPLRGLPPGTRIVPAARPAASGTGASPELALTAGGAW